jgi:hypothetical protein
MTAAVVVTKRAPDTERTHAKNLARDVSEKGLDAALKGYARTKAGPASSYYFDLEELTEAGDQLSKAGKKKEAVEVFKIGVAESPWSYSVHESLGDAYTRIGESYFPT